MIIDPNKKLFAGSVDAFLHQKDAVFYPVLLKDATNILHEDFMSHRHPFTEGMKAYGQNPELHVKDSPMAYFYQTYQPKNHLEAFFGTRENPLLKNASEEDIKPLISFSTRDYLAPWVESPIPMGGIGDGLDASHGSHYLGPVSDLFLEREYQRLVGIYNSVQAQGFNLTLQTDTIRGYFIRHQGMTRSIIVGGNHRAGVLTALKAPYIPVERHPDRPTLVQLEDLNEWPQVKNNTMSKAIAEAIFLSFFTFASHPKRPR